MDTHLEAVTYPFRAEAVKHIIYLVNEPCPDTSILTLLLARAPVQYKKEITLSYISPLGLKTKNEKVTKEIIGFSSEKVYTLSNPLGTPQLKDDLLFENICVDHVLAVSL